MGPGAGGSAERVRELVTRTLREGARESAARLAVRAATRLRHERLDFLLPEDVSDSASLRLPPGRRLPTGAPATIGWVCSPPVPGSGGHTTFFRMVEELERRGHVCVLFLYDAHGGDLARQTAVIRQHWPTMRAEIRDARNGLDGLDAGVASGWETAHVLATRGTAPMHRFYFIQDFEPFFYPHGSHYALAEDSYRFGLHHIALGGAVAGLLKSEVGVGADVVPFGCDTDVYRLASPPAPRRGIVFFARPHVPRRGFLMGMLALEQFHSRHPEQEIHVYGDALRGAHFPVTDHGRLRPHELNDLYNRTIGGLALSFTNVTLVADEMLASGNIPVANKNPYSHAGLANEHVVWADPTPGALADALCGLVESTEIATRAARAAEIVTGSWADSRAQVARIIEDVLWD